MKKMVLSLFVVFLMFPVSQAFSMQGSAALVAPRVVVPTSACASPLVASTGGFLYVACNNALSTRVQVYQENTTFPVLSGTTSFNGGSCSSIQAGNEWVYLTCAQGVYAMPAL
ncbi:MAG: hypothetical protein I8H75_04500 [Myxococcaceae bacterium]|nr:hypothetical protein [Myxococcaceae bacterium]MBH2006583.1 hypothetical protein [Myxococcaceae bacterium]